MKSTKKWLRSLSREQNGTNDVAGFIEAHDDRLPPELIEEAKAAAHAAGLPFSEKPYRDGEDFDPYACYSSFLSLLSLFPTTEKKLFCRTYPKEKRCNLKKRLQRFLKSIFNFAGHFHLSSFSTSLISFAVAVTIRIPLSLMVSSNVSSCRRCVFFVSGFSKRNWSTDIS